MIFMAIYFLMIWFKHNVWFFKKIKKWHLYGPWLLIFNVKNASQNQRFCHNWRNSAIFIWMILWLLIFDAKNNSFFDFKRFEIDRRMRSVSPFWVPTITFNSRIFQRKRACITCWFIIMFILSFYLFWWTSIIQCCKYKLTSIHY